MYTLNAMQKQSSKTKLASKIRVVPHPQNPVKPSHKRLRFYTKYAAVVFETLRKPLFQRFLNWMIKRENIEEGVVKDVQVRVFPFRKENGKKLAGRWSNKGKILIFPKRLAFLREMVQNCSKEKVCFYIRGRAMATLIHELLHVKYSNEDKVRELTRKYFNIYILHQNTQNTNAHSIQKMLFPN